MNEPDVLPDLRRAAVDAAEKVARDMALNNAPTHDWGSRKLIVSAVLTAGCIVGAVTSGHAITPEVLLTCASPLLAWAGLEGLGDAVERGRRR